MSFKSFDIYPKLNDEFRVRTGSGAVVSILAIIIIIILFTTELSYYLQTETVDHLYVDISRGEKVRINFDVTFPYIPCSLLSLDAMDVSGEHQLDVNHHIKKKALDKYLQPIGGEIKHELGKTLNEKELKDIKHNSSNPVAGPVAKIDITKTPGYCGPCYGAELDAKQCCNTCDNVKEAYRVRGWALPPLTTIEQCLATGQTDDNIMLELQRGDGCEMYGYLEVNKVAGNFHFAPGKSFQHAHMHVHDLAVYASNKFNVSHFIKELSFGEPYPGRINPLDSTSKLLASESDLSGMVMYYIKVVPTEYEYLYGSQLKTNQFSVTEHFRSLGSREGQGLPGVFFFYELSPIMVRFTETRKSFFHFLTQLCAIIGGVFTVAGMLDKLVYHSLRSLEGKNTQGKLI